MRQPAAIGRGCLAILCAVTLSAPKAEAAFDSLYRTIKADVMAEQSTFQVSDEVATFAQAILTQAGKDITLEQVRLALTLPASAVCNAGQADNSDTAADDPGNEEENGDRTDCNELVRRAIEIMKRESLVRELGNSLQPIATTAELATDSYPGMGSESLLLTAAIRAIWGTNATGDDPSLQVRTWPENDSTIAGDLQQIDAILSRMSDEERTGATWRALYGTRFAKGELGGQNEADTPADPDNAPGTERQYLWKEQPELDQALLKLRADLFAADAGDEDDEKRVIDLFPPQKIGDNVVWVTSDDVGLRQRIPLHPVLPSLGDSVPIKGGLWPPAPPGPTLAPSKPSDENDSRGLCLIPIAADGHLCRAPTGETSPCRTTVGPQAGTIILAACAGDEESTKLTPAGPLACEDLDWHLGGFSPDDQCQPELKCDPVCNDNSGTPNPEEEFHVYSKVDQNGQEAIVRGCMKTGDRLLPGYRALQAGAGLRLICESQNNVALSDLLPPEELEVVCCSQISEMATVMCRAMEEDGVFTEGNERAVSKGGEPLSVGTCAMAFAIDSCGPSCGGPLPAGYLDELIERANKNPAGRATECEEAVNEEEGRLRALLYEAETINESCSPDRLVEMDNTILANTCYADRCLEYSLKLHNLTPAFGALTTFDAQTPLSPAVFPRQEPEEAIEVAPLLPDRLPTDYSPGEIAKNFDIGVCQINGLPPLTPPVLCAVDPLRRLTLPMVEPFGQQANLDQQIGDLALDQSIFRLSGLPAGIRLGDDLFLETLRPVIQELNDSVEGTVRLLNELPDIEFANELCPLSPTQELESSRSNSSSL